MIIIRNKGKMLQEANIPIMDPTNDDRGTGKRKNSPPIDGIIEIGRNHVDARTGLFGRGRRVGGSRGRGRWQSDRGR